MVFGSALAFFLFFAASILAMKPGENQWAKDYAWLINPFWWGMAVSGVVAMPSTRWFRVLYQKMNLSQELTSTALSQKTQDHHGSATAVGQIGHIGAGAVVHIGAGEATDPPRVHVRRDKSWIKIVRPHTRSCFARVEHDTFRECQIEESECILTLCTFNSDAGILTAQLLYENGSGDISPRVHGCWMYQQFAYVRPEIGKTCELILCMSNADNEHAILDDKRHYRDPHSAIHPRAMVGDDVKVTVFTYVDDDEGPEFCFSLQTRENRIVAALMQPP